MANRTATTGKFPQSPPGKLAAVCLVVVVATYPGAAVRAAQPGWATYQNGRFGYSMEYPADLLSPLPESDSGDGRAFKPRHGHADVRVWASYDDEALSDLANTAEQDCAQAKASYKAIKANKSPAFMALSCDRPDHSVLYVKAVRCRDVTTELKITYPPAEAATWEPAVTGISRSLGAGCGAD